MQSANPGERSGHGLPDAVPLPAGCREQVLHDGDRTRVSRLLLPDGSTLICKEALGVGAVARLRSETGILQRLNGLPGVARLARYTRPGALLMIDDGGRALAELIEEPGLDAPAALRFAAELARTVAAVHACGVVHKDINPANVLAVGPSLRPVLIDFDLATTFAEDRPGFSPHGEIVGTLAYLPPEQTGRTARLVDQRADLYALGATLYELASGAAPFDVADELQLIRDILLRAPQPLAEVAAPKFEVTPALSALVSRLLDKEPDQRYQSAAGLAHDLTRLAAGDDDGLQLGAMDFPLRLAPPSRLVGRENEIAAMRTAFGRAQGARHGCVLVAGAPGVGKSALIDELRPVVAAAGGWFCSGKSDQYQSSVTAGAMLQALRGIGRFLLAESEEQLVRTRDRLVEVLGGDLGLVTGLLPEFEVLLGRHAEPDFGAADAVEIESRRRQTILALLHVVVSPMRPVVLVLDDVQWADPLTVGLLDSLLTGEALPGLLLVIARRDGSLPAEHPLSVLFGRCRRLGIVLDSLVIANLAPTELGTLLAEMLRLPAVRCAELAEAVRAWTAGNPFDTVELVNTLRRDGVLVLGEGGWSWSIEAIGRYVGSGDVVDLLRDRLNRLPPATGDLLRLMACLGGEIELSVLAGSAGQSVELVADRLVPALEDGLLIDERIGPDRGVRFRHDRVQQAAYSSMTPAERGELHLRLGRRLAGLAGRAVLAADQYLTSAQTLTDPGENRRLIQLLVHAADQAMLTSDFLSGERYLAAAGAACRALGAEPGDPVLFDIEVARHAALHGLGRLDEADAVYAGIEFSDPDPVRLTRPACAQISSLCQRTEHAAALTLGLRLVARLGLAGPDEAFVAELPGRLAELISWAGRLDLAADLARAEPSDPQLLCLDKLFSRLLPVAFFLGDRTTVAWLVLASQRIWAEYGPSAGLGANLSCAGLLVAPALGDFRIGYLIGRHVLAISEARGYEPQTSVLRHRHALHLMPWMEPLQNGIRQAELAREGLLRGGDLQMASHTCLTLVAATLDTGRTLEGLAAEIDAAISFAARTGNDHSAQSVVGYHQFALSMMRDSGEPGDGWAPLGEVPASLRANPMASGIYHTCRALAAAIFGDADELSAHSALAMAQRRFIPGYPGAIIQLVRVLALARQVGPATPVQRSEDRVPDPALVAELIECRDWLAARAADQPENFAGMALLAEAEWAWAIGDHRVAAQAFDAAAAAVGNRERRWQRALIAERAAGFYLESGLVETATHWLVEARAQYRAWGASAKVDQLDHDHVMPAPVDPSAQPASSRSSTRRGGRALTDSIDMFAVLQCSQALSTATSLDGLHDTIVEQLTALTGATDVLLVVRSGLSGQWHLPATSTSREPVEAELAGSRGQLPITAFRYAERLGEPLLVEDAVADDRFARDPYLIGLTRCSLLAIPIISQGQARAVLILTNQQSSGAFADDRLDAVTLIAGQLVVSLDNAVLYESLEARVTQRTEALASANKQLQTLSLTDPLTELGNRRRFEELLTAEWARAAHEHRPLAVVMIDVDHFKRFNDQYGHQAGDACLRRVAGAMRGAVRGSSDQVCRYGGEEFVMVLPDADDAGCRAAVQRTLEAVSGLAMPHAGSDLGVVTVSMGVAIGLPTDTDGADGLIALADAALYRAKQAGRNTFVLSDAVVVN